LISDDSVRIVTTYSEVALAKMLSASFVKKRGCRYRQPLRPAEYSAESKSSKVRI
jgi:hypothetical protein